jgi:hypothetical protein
MIKKALNNSLGTDGFKPLDAILNKGFEEVKALQRKIKQTADGTLEKLTNGENDFIASKAKAVDGYVFQKLTGALSADAEFKIDKTGLYIVEADIPNIGIKYSTMIYISNLTNEFRSSFFGSLASENLNLIFENGYLRVGNSPSWRIVGVYRLNVVVEEANNI